MTVKTLWGQRRGLLLVASGLALALTHCRSTGSEEHEAAGAANAAGMDAAGVSSVGDSAAGVTDSGAGSAGMELSAGGAVEVGADDPDAGGAVEVGAGGDDAGAGGDDAGAGGAPAETLEFVFRRQAQPIVSGAFAADLDGDGNPENAYGKVISALGLYGFPAQASSDEETNAGRGLQLLSLHASDSSLLTGSATLELWRAEPLATPDLKGTGSFVVDSTVPGASLNGVIKGTVLTNVEFSPGAQLPRMLFHLPFGGSVDLPVSIYSISFHVAANGLSEGQLNGAVMASDVNAIVPSALAVEFDKQCVGVLPLSQQCQIALLLLDTDNDKHVSATELRESSLIAGVLAPDVKLFDEQGNFAPDGSAAVKDALSIGFGFSAALARISH